MPLTSTTPASSGRCRRSGSNALDWRGFHRAPSCGSDLWSRCGVGKSQASLQASIASKLAPPVFGTGPGEGSLWEAAFAADGTSSRRWAHVTAAVGVRRPLPQEPPRWQRFGRIPCGSGLGRDAARISRGPRYRPQSRASSLPQNLAGSNSRRSRCAVTAADRRRIGPGVAALPSGRRWRRRRTGEHGVPGRVR